MRCEVMDGLEYEGAVERSDRPLHSTAAAQHGVDCPFAMHCVLDDEETCTDIGFQHSRRAVRASICQQCHHRVSLWLMIVDFVSAVLCMDIGQCQAARSALSVRLGCC